MALGTITLLAFLAYLNIFRNDFALDDYSFIVRWPLIQDMRNFPLFFGNQNQPWGEEGIYSPLKTFFHAVNYQLWGLNPVGHHVVSILVHVGATILVYFIALHITKNNLIAFLSSLFFGLHPAHVEAITFMTASVDMIGSLFFFLSFLLYIKNSQAGGRFLNRGYVLSIIFAALAIFTYELTISLPFLFLIYEFYFSGNRGKPKRAALRLAPFFSIAVIYVLLKFLILHTVAREGYLYGSFYLTMLVSIKAMVKYVLVIFWPVYLTVNHVISKGIYSFAADDFDRNAVLSQSFRDPQVMISLALIFAVLYWAIRSSKKQPIPSFCIFWFFVGLLPASNIIPSEIFFGERYLYLSSFGFCLFLGYFLTLLYERKSLLCRCDPKLISLAIIIVLVTFYTVRTVARNRDWESDLSIKKTRAALCPQSALMHAQLGSAYTDDGQSREALESFNRALAIQPGSADTYFSMADAYMQLDKKEQAIASLNKAIELKPDFAEGYFNLAVAYALSGQKQKAEDALQKSLALYRMQNKIDEADKAQEAFDRYFHPSIQEILPAQEPFYPEQ